ncbi:hypothetical protein NPIL_699931, partial [Nephila pilipes]
KFTLQPSMRSTFVGILQELAYVK